MHSLLPLTTIISLGLLVATPTLASAEGAPQETASSPTFGVGYKLGNGVGFAGIDLIASPIPHLAFELQLSHLADFESGYAILPSAVGTLRATGSTPYVKVGALYLAVSDSDVTVTGSGGFANIGYEWRFNSGLGIQLGGGVGYIQDITAVSGNTIVSIGGEAHANLELGLRYRF